MRLPAFFLLVISIALLVGCTTPAAPLSEVSVPTQPPPAVVAIAASPTASFTALATITSIVIPTSMPTIVSTPPPVTPYQPPVTMTPYIPPTDYPPSKTPTPTATPHYTEDGQWQIVTKQATRFEIPAAWFADYSEMTSYAPLTTDAPPPTPTDGSGLRKLEYYEISYHRYAGYTGIEGTDAIQVDGYPARRMTGCSEE